MAKAKHAIPEGLTTITTMLSIDGCTEAIELYKKAFGAVEIARAADPSGQKIWHAVIRIGNAQMFVNDIFPEMGPSAAIPSAGRNWLYFEDCDAAYRRAIDAGMTSDQPPTDMFWGDRHARVSDKFGNAWAIATHTEDLTPAEIQARQDAFVAEMAKQHQK